MTFRRRTACLGLASLICLAGCQGPTIGSTNAAAMANAFIGGQIQLERNNPIALPSPWYRRRVKALWANRQWADLAKEVIEDGYDMDINWFYLGEAARGQNFMTAAREYYSKALADSQSQYGNRRCDNFPGLTPDYDMCAGFVFPRDVVSRLQGRG